MGESFLVSTRHTYRGRWGGEACFAQEVELRRDLCGHVFIVAVAFSQFAICFKSKLFWSYFVVSSVFRITLKCCSLTPVSNYDADFATLSAVKITLEVLIKTNWSEDDVVLIELESQNGVFSMADLFANLGIHRNDFSRHGGNSYCDRLTLILVFGRCN
ncbi:hypothetical protein V6N13_095536 [Hibiscus sabdariffa]